MYMKNVLFEVFYYMKKLKKEKNLINSLPFQIQNLKVVIVKYICQKCTSKNFFNQCI